MAATAPANMRPQHDSTKVETKSYIKSWRFTARAWSTFSIERRVSASCKQVFLHRRKMKAKVRARILAVTAVIQKLWRMINKKTETTKTTTHLSSQQTSQITISDRGKHQKNHRSKLRTTAKNLYSKISKWKIWMKTTYKAIQKKSETKNKKNKYQWKTMKMTIGKHNSNNKK